MAIRCAFGRKQSVAAAAMLVCGWANPAAANDSAVAISTPLADGSIDITATSLLPSPLAPAASVAAPHVTFGRAMDIVGVPIDFSRVKPRSTTGLASAGRGLGAKGLGGQAVMPGRLPLVAARLSSRFGMRGHPLLGGVRAHSGVDLAAAHGTPIYAPAAGIVSAAQWQGGYGLLVAIAHAGGMYTRYGHLSRIAVAPGQSVRVGEVIGYVGSTGLSTGPHLHYEVRINGAAVNPLAGARSP